MVFQTENNVCIWQCCVDRHRVDADPDLYPTFYFDADSDPDPDPSPRFTHVGIPKFFLVLLLPGVPVYSVLFFSPAFIVFNISTVF